MSRFAVNELFVEPASLHKRVLRGNTAPLKRQQMKISPLNRREFLAAAAAGICAPRRPLLASMPAWEPAICVFTKPFNSLSFDELADQISRLGFHGIEAPIREKGHIEPADVDEKLPQLVEALAARNLEVTVLTSSVNDVAAPHTESVLRTAAGLGIKRYRMKYFKYDFNRPIAQQLVEWKAKFRDLAQLNRELKITGLYQNHAGEKYLGSSIWDVQRVLQDISPREIGVAYDIRHATVEGGTCWPATFHMIKSHVAMVYVKDFLYGATKNDRVRNVPLGDGFVHGPKFIKMLRAAGYDGPISLHEEYLDHRQPELVSQHLAAIKKDLGVLRDWIRSSA